MFKLISSETIIGQVSLRTKDCIIIKEVMKVVEGIRADGAHVCVLNSYLPIDVLTEFQIKENTVITSVQIKDEKFIKHYFSAVKQAYKFKDNLYSDALKFSGPGEDSESDPILDLMEDEDEFIKRWTPDKDYKKN